MSYQEGSIQPEDALSMQEKNLIVSIVVAVVIMGFYFYKLYELYLSEALTSPTVYQMWGWAMIQVIIVRIVLEIVMQIIFQIINVIITRKEERDVTDERDRLIGYKGMRIAYLLSSTGLVAGLITITIGWHPLVMLNLIFFSVMFSEIVSDVTQIILYRRGI